MEIITGDPGYQPSVRALRQLAEALPSSNLVETDKLVDRLDLLKRTVSNQPLEESIRLELLLASLQASRSIQRGIDRLLETYFSLEPVEELDTLCYCLARVLIALPDIDPTDSQHLVPELEQQLNDRYEELLRGTADHFTVTRRLIRAVTVYKPDLALQFAAKLNTAPRRDDAFREIIRVYIDQSEGDFDPDFIWRVWESVYEPSRRQRTLLFLIEQLALKQLLGTQPRTREFLNLVDKMDDPIHQCLAYAFAIDDLARTPEATLVDHLAVSLKRALTQVDSLWDRVKLGLDLATIVAENAPELARSLLEQARIERKENPLAEPVFAEVYLNGLYLALHAFDGVLQCDPNYTKAQSNLIDMIQAVPSSSYQCELFADLALRHRLAAKVDEFEKLVKQFVLPYFENCSNQAARTRALVQAAACLFEYDADWFMELVSSLPSVERDDALSGVVRYLISGLPSSDPVDLESMSRELEVKEARQVCRVIGAMSADVAIYSSIEQLVGTLVQPASYEPNRDTCPSLAERDALDIAARLEAIAKDKLPDKNGIQHNGYSVVVRASAFRLRAAASRRSKETPPWTELVEEAKTIPNTADRAFVLALVGQNMYRSNMVLGKNTLDEAETLLETIPSMLDRLNHYDSMAKSWQEVGEKDAAKLLLENAMRTLGALDWDRTREDVSDRILKLAHSIDPDFASSLVPLIDNPIARRSADRSLAVRSLQKDPQKLHAEKQRNARHLQHLLGDAAWYRLRSLNSNVGRTVHQRDVGQWLLEMVHAEFEETMPVVEWSLKNAFRSKQQPAVINGSYEAIADCVQLSRLISQLLLRMRVDLPRVNPALPKHIQLFRAGSRQEAAVTLREWVEQNASEYLKIYDPYFGLDDLEIIKHLDPDITVFIVTGWKAQMGTSAGDRDIERRYRETWSRISEEEPPETQITIVGTRSGDSPLHNRYILTQGAGVELSTSVSGLGNKDSNLRVLPADEASAIEDAFVNSELTAQLRLYKGEKLIRFVFTL